MVGRQTSRGCATCRRRKVQCDNVKPACNRCIKIGRACPGYSDRFVSVSSERCGPREATRTSDPQSADQIIGMCLKNPMFSKADRLRHEFVWKLESDALAARITAMPTTHVLRHIPQRIGYSQALDDAVVCISQNIHTRHLYVTALTSLRKALDDGHYTPETLGAASLLQMYEQYIDYGGKQWIYHARGVVKMLRVQGSAKITDELGKAVFEAQAVNVFTANLGSIDVRFLTNPAWSGVLRSRPASESPIEAFMQVVADGNQLEYVDEIYAQLVSTCQKYESLPRQQRERLINVAIADFVRIRAQLKQQLATISKLSSGTCNVTTTAAGAATGFFLIVADTILLGMYDQLQAVCGQLPALVSGDLMPIHMTAERSSTLDLVNERFRLLEAQNMEIRFIAPTTLRIILGSVLGSAEPSASETATTLLVLDQELENRS